jgi:branched-chain amino acid transport system permease protein
MLGSIYAMVAVALTLGIGVLRFLNFSIPGLFMVGGMLTWALVRNAVPWPLAAGAALLLAAAASSFSPGAGCARRRNSSRS